MPIFIEMNLSNHKIAMTFKFFQICYFMKSFISEIMTKITNIVIFAYKKQYSISNEMV